MPAQQTTSWSDYIKSLFARPVFTGMAMAAAALAIIWGVSLFSQLDQQQTQLANLEATITAQDVQLSDIEASNESLTKRLEDTETTNVALTGRLEDVEAENEQLEGSNEALRQQLRDQENVLAIYNDPATQIVAVGGTEAQPEAIGRLTTSPSNNSLTFATNKLASLPTNEIYQLWLINDDGPVGMGIFSVNEDGMGEITIDLPEGIDTFTAVGVSIEPSGGSDQPTGDIVLLGSL